MLYYNINTIIMSVPLVSRRCAGAHANLLFRPTIIPVSCYTRTNKTIVGRGAVRHGSGEEGPAWIPSSALLLGPAYFRVAFVAINRWVGTQAVEPRLTE